MQHEECGPVPPQPIPPAYAQRQTKTGDRRLNLIAAAVELHGAAYSVDELAEQTGLPKDAIRRFAAQAMVFRNMVELEMIDHEDATRMGSEALAASLRIEAKRRNRPLETLHASIAPTANAKPLTTADVMGLRRLDARRRDARPVVAPRTMCPRCGARSDVDGGCRHQRALMPTDTIEQGPTTHA